MQKLSVEPVVAQARRDRHGMRMFGLSVVAPEGCGCRHLGEPCQPAPNMTEMLVIGSFVMCILTNCPVE